MQHHTSQRAQTTRYIIHRHGHQKTLSMTQGSVIDTMLLKSQGKCKTVDQTYVWSKAFVPFAVLHVYTAGSSCICFGFRSSARAGL